MNENYNKCGCERVAHKEPTIQNIVAETLGLIDKLNEQLSSICETLYGTACGNHQKLEAKCLNDALVLLLDKANVANEQAFRIREAVLMELKPCPFCGKSVAHVDSIANHEMMNEYESDYFWSSTHYDVVCDYHNGGCGASTGKGNATPEEAIEAWNRRASE